jgi:hypothetical protein
MESNEQAARGPAPDADEAPVGGRVTALPEPLAKLAEYLNRGGFVLEIAPAPTPEAPAPGHPDPAATKE